MNQAHIVGISPRSGTTLMAELMLHCFDFDAWADHELPVYFAPEASVETLCTKKPSDIEFAARAMKARQSLWIVCMIRDPRDIVVSRHRNVPDKYYANLGIVLGRMKHLRRVQEHKRFAGVKYEDLVSDPDRTQTHLKLRFPFLRQTAHFSEFHSIAMPTESSVAALNGVRPISTTSIGRWRKHLPRIRAQVDRYPEIVDVLVELGYEKDDQWMRDLDSIVADNGPSHFEDLRSRPLLKVRRSLMSNFLMTRQQLGWPKKARVLRKIPKSS